MSTNVAKACKKSTMQINALRLHLSTNTPAKGARIIIGAKPTREANDKYKGL